jgi:crossover junction endodeoxyribonuclease RuvC
MILIGIDPGLTGAIAMLGHDAEYLHVADIPTMQRMAEPKKGRVMNQVNWGATRELLRTWILQYDRTEVHAVIELPIAFPGQDVRSVAASHLTAGHLEGVVHSLRIAHTLVAPKDWKKALNLTSSKEQARAAAIRRWPDATTSLKRVMDHNRAEALLIARYGHERFA